jgi:hypothetical protein
MSVTPPRLERLLEGIFDDCRSGLKQELSAAEYDRRRHDFVFHMTDWLADLNRLHTMFKDPATQKIPEATVELIGILYHVVPHLSAAGRLLLDQIPDAFAEDGVSVAQSKTP